MKKGRYASQETKIWQDTVNLIDLGILEKKIDNTPDSRGRKPKTGRPFYRVVPNLDVLAILNLIQKQEDIGLYKSHYIELIDNKKLREYLNHKDVFDFYTLTKEEKDYKERLSQIQPKLNKLKSKINKLTEAKRARNEQNSQLLRKTY